MAHADKRSRRRSDTDLASAPPGPRLNSNRHSVPTFLNPQFASSVFDHDGRLVKSFNGTSDLSCAPTDEQERHATSIKKQFSASALENKRRGRIVRMRNIRSMESLVLEEPASSDHSISPTPKPRRKNRQVGDVSSGKAFKGPAPKPPGTPEGARSSSLEDDAFLDKSADHSFGSSSKGGGSRPPSESDSLDPR